MGKCLKKNQLKRLPRCRIETIFPAANKWIRCANVQYIIGILAIN